MRLAFVLTILLASTMATALSLDEQEVFIRMVRFRYNLGDQGEAFVRAVLRLENGRRGSEAGMNIIRPTSFTHPSDPQSYSDPTAPDGAEQHYRLARRLSRHMQNWVFSQPELRAEWLQSWSNDFLAGGLPIKTWTGKKRKPTETEMRARNWRYFRSLQEIWREERAKMRKRNRKGGYNPEKDDGGD